MGEVQEGAILEETAEAVTTKESPFSRTRFGGKPSRVPGPGMGV